MSAPMRNSMPLHRPRVAVVVGAGSVKCAAALGMFRLLHREGVPIDMLVGCSAGALYTACIALGMTVEETAERNRRLWTREVVERPDRMALLRALFPRLLGFDEHWGLKSDRLLGKRLDAAFGDHTFSDCSIPLYVLAADFANGEQVVLSEGRIADAVRASVALPFAFPPVRIGNRVLIDGFVADPLPVGVAMREGADVIIAMGFESVFQEHIHSPSRYAMQLSSILSNNLLKATCAFHGAAHHGEVLLVVPQFTERIRLFDIEKMPYIMDEGERAMREQMPYLLRLLGSVGVRAES